MRGSGTMARAMATRCFWPPESRPPPALHCVAKPCFSLMMKSCALASRAACTTARGRQKSRRDPVAPAAALAAVPTWGHVHVRLVDAGVAVADVVGDAVGEEDRLLLHQPQLRPQPPHAVPLNRRPAPRHLPFRRRPLSAHRAGPGDGSACQDNATASRRGNRRWPWLRLWPWRHRLVRRTAARILGGCRGCSRPRKGAQPSAAP